ncbi:hypothetical protein PAPYR_12165 [Paratrimastix pyriformis]|uniref:Uncharacterized protein n=1 Tax=Paratrimastix pyriformis TaxID=342808 RepID=A0ABQ8U2C9_9EUKA|nr:hypothetical protein PAPYR_12165 [Paratrimastix pyriformis]
MDFSTPTNIARPVLMMQIDEFHRKTLGMMSEHHLENSISIENPYRRKALRNFVRRAAAAVTRLLVTRGMTPRRRNREAIRGNVRAEPKSSAADAAPASPLRLDTVTEDEAEQEETQRASQEHEATEQEQEEIQHASQDADQHHPSELQQTGTEPEAAEQSVPGEPEQLAEPEQPAEPELTPNPSRPQPLLRRPQSSPQRRTAPPSSSLAPPPKPRAGSPGYQEVRSRSPDIDPGNPAFTAAAGCWFNRCSQDASASGIRAFQNPTCSPCRVLRLTCSPGHRHEHYCHASSSGSGSGFRASQNPTCSPGHRHEHDCHASSSGSGLQQWLRIELPCLPERPAPPRVPRHQSLPQLRVLISLCRRRTPPPPLNRIYLVWQSETKEVLKLTRQAFYERIFPKLLASWFPSTNHLNRGLIVPVHFFETMAEYRLSGAICVEMHKVLNRADIEKTYQFLTSRALMILVCLDSEAAFGVDRAVDGHMRLDELALWERTFPSTSREVFQACEREYLALSEDERKTYDWSIQCHKFRTNTCYREIPAHWDCLFKFTGNA